MIEDRRVRRAERTLRLVSVKLRDGNRADAVSAEQMANGQKPSGTRIGAQRVGAPGMPKRLAGVSGTQEQ